MALILKLSLSKLSALYVYETEISGHFVIIETKDQSSLNQICGKVHAFFFLVAK